MARRFIGTRGNRGGPRRETEWASLAVDVDTITAPSTAVLVGSLNAAALALRPFTVVRVRGFWFVSDDQEAVTENWGCSMGWAVVSDQASAIGVTAVPTPETDKGSDLWFVYEEMYGRFHLDTAVGHGEIGSHGKFDSKAMRKVNGDQDIIVALETPAVIQGALVLMGARFLLKLH